ncbi:MAG: type II toxin-antitoxin system VapC family toxin [Solirubrobacterales bacterium]
MIAPDASVLIAHLSPKDTHHEAATGILLAHPPGQMLVHPVTLAEVLVGGVRIGQGASMSEDLRGAGLGIAIGDDGGPLRLAELRTTTGLKMPDCCVLGVAIQQHASLATFDEALATAARRLSVPVIP